MGQESETDSADIAVNSRTPARTDTSPPTDTLEVGSLSSRLRATSIQTTRTFKSRPHGTMTMHSSRDVKEVAALGLCPDSDIRRQMHSPQRPTGFCHRSDPSVGS